MRVIDRAAFLAGRDRREHRDHRDDIAFATNLRGEFERHVRARAKVVITMRGDGTQHVRRNEKAGHVDAVEGNTSPWRTGALACPR